MPNQTISESFAVVASHLDAKRRASRLIWASTSSFPHPWNASKEERESQWSAYDIAEKNVKRLEEELGRASRIKDEVQHWLVLAGEI